MTTVTKVSLRRVECLRLRGLTRTVSKIRSSYSSEEGPPKSFVVLQIRGTWWNGHGLGLVHPDPPLVTTTRAELMYGWDFHFSLTISTSVDSDSVYLTLNPFHPVVSFLLPYRILPFILDSSFLSCLQVM